MFFDIQYRQMHKKGEELCGDSVAIYHGEGETVLVLADGLGSGVKANILATLTQKIALTMVKEHLPLEEVVQTIAATLPTCKVRNLAYSTFTILRAEHSGQAELVEFDNPLAFFFRNGMLEPLPREERQVEGFTLQQCAFTLEEGDVLVVVSDGLTHAGIGGREPLGWRWKPIAEYLEGLVGQESEAEEVADNLLAVAERLYGGNVGDDTSVVVVKCRPYREVTLAVGPPSNARDDQKMAQRLDTAAGVKIICGGTTAKLIARELDRQLEIDLSVDARDLPPPGKIAGMDLVTEGVITIMHAIDILDAVRLHKPRVNTHDLGFMYGRRDLPSLTRGNVRPPAEEVNPAETLARYLRLADKVTILLGCALNPAHQNPELPIHLGLKFHLVDHLSQKLRARGKVVDVVTFD